jgi:purine-binding chemotaxis protein CheW
MGDGFEWQEAYTKLDRARQTLEAGGNLSAEDVGRTLRERARALARPLAESKTPAEVLDVLVFSLAGERYGVEASYVLEVLPLRELTPLPCVPPVFAGVMNYRGRILPVLDIRRLFGLSGQGTTEGNRVVVMEANSMALGILTESVAGIVRIDAQEITPPPVTLAGDRQAFLRGVTGEMLAVIDLPTLIRDPRVVVNEQ